MAATQLSPLSSLNPGIFSMYEVCCVFCATSLTQANHESTSKVARRFPLNGKPRSRGRVVRQEVQQNKSGKALSGTLSFLMGFANLYSEHLYTRFVSGRSRENYPSHNGGKTISRCRRGRSRNISAP